MKSIGAALLLLCVAWPLRAQAANSSLQFQSGMLEVDGGQIYYEVAGRGPDLVLIHGGFGDRRMWDDQFNQFAKNFRVVRYDHRGFGKSTAPQSNYSPVGDLARLLDHLKIKRAHIIGNSMGGGLAIDFAIKHPERVTSMVVVASGPNGYPAPQEDVDRVIAIFKLAEEKGAAEAAAAWIQHPMVAVTSKDPKARPQLQRMIDENSRIFTMQFWPEEPMDPLAHKRLAEIKAPTLIVIGGKDTPVVREMGEVAAAGIAGAQKAVIEGADHLPQMASPQEFNRVVLKFLRGVK
jgi:pimeloyl-ACP methyl ester carboxylesterase